MTLWSPEWWVLVIALTALIMSVIHGFRRHGGDTSAIWSKLIEQDRRILEIEQTLRDPTVIAYLPSSRETWPGVYRRGR